MFNRDDLTLTEQKHVRTALRFLSRKHGDWKTLARSLPFEVNTLRAVMRGERCVSPTLAFRVARLESASFDDLLAGRVLPGACAHCGAAPDFADEPTTVGDADP